MSIFQAQSGAGKVAADLTTISVMSSTSKYVKEGPVPVGTYEHSRTLQPNERYGANRRLQRKPQDANHSKIQQQTPSSNNISNKPSLGTEETNVVDKDNQITATQKQEIKESAVVNTPRSQISDVYTYRKIEKNNMTPRDTPIAVGFKSALQQIMDRTPQPTRYGANRKLPQPKPQQSGTKNGNTVQLTTQIQPPEVIKNTPTQNRESLKPVQKPVSQQIKTPQPSKQTLTTQPVSRYGANRRLQTPKPQEAQVKPVEVQTSKQQQETTPKNKQVKPYSRNNAQISTPNNKIQNVRTPIAPKQVANTEAPTEKESTTVPEVTSENKVIVRSNVRPQLKSKIETPSVKKDTEVEATKTEQPAHPKKQSKVVFFILTKIYRSKIAEPFGILHQNCKLKKKKQSSFSKIFVNKLHALERQIAISLIRSSFMKLVGVKTVSPAKKVDAGSAETIRKSCQKLLILVLQKLYTKQSSFALAKLAGTKSKKASPIHLVGSLNKIWQKLGSTALTKIRSYSTNYFLIKKRLLSYVSLISIEYKLRVTQTAFRKLLCVKKLEEKSKVLVKNEKRSPIHDFDQDSSSLPSPVSSPKKNDKQKEKDQKLIEKLEIEIKQNTIKLQNAEKQLNAQKMSGDSKLESLRMNCDQLSQQNQQKRRVSEQLKQKAMSIQYTEEDYIETADLLLDTKFPILYDAYIKVEKSNGEEIKIDNLIQIFMPNVEEAHRDKLVSLWISLNKNLSLKKEVSRYEGESAGIRKAAKVVQEEGELLSQLSRGYIRERYTWEWVKSALSNISHG